MKYYSTNNPLHQVDLRQAVLRSIGPDGGVYMPDHIPLFPSALFKHISQMSLQEIGYIVASSMFGNDIPLETIKNIVSDTLTFDIPLIEIEPRLYALELFHGPTGSFKDIGARFMAHILKYLMTDTHVDQKKINVFVATSGDTGSAVAAAFEGMPDINLFIFHPKENLLRTSRKGAQIGQAPNIHTIAIRGTFEDCQQLVKEIYCDVELNRRMTITSANTVNIARLLPQIIFYFHAYARLLEREENPGLPIFSTPCGNLGNLTAALFSTQMGLPASRILASGFGNERLWGTIGQTGQLNVSDFNTKALATNLSRINRLLLNNPAMGSMIECHTFADEQVSDEISTMLETHDYLLARNSAMACRAARLNKKDSESAIFLATTDPDISTARIHNAPPLPRELARTHGHRPLMALPPVLSIVRERVMAIANDSDH